MRSKTLRLLHVFCLAAAILLPLTLTALSFEERVALQESIEEVYWRHTIWPADNSHPKPSLKTVMPGSMIRFKVNEYLTKSNALAIKRQKSIGAEELQAEMERIANDTRDPEILRELWAALRNDPYLIAEAFARPVIVDRLAQESVGFERGWEGQNNQKAARVDEPRHQYSLPAITGYLSAGVSSQVELAAETPSGRFWHTAVWTGVEMIVWGGLDNAFSVLKTGGRYNPTTNAWTATNLQRAPAERYLSSAVWTGTHMIVWGGFDNTDTQIKTGGRYNPLTNTWSSTATKGAPSARYQHTAVWTGTHMIIWGGEAPTGTSFNNLNTGGRYNPVTNSWAKTTTSGAPSPRISHTAIWTGTHMIIWGGDAPSSTGTINFNSGGRYNPSSNSWAPTSTDGAPSPRTSHTAVWTGTQMIVWGGLVNGVGDLLKDGARYSPTTDSWKTISSTGTPSARGGHTAVWSGTQMIVWGGRVGFFGPVSDSGGRYNPVTDSWKKTSSRGTPSARDTHTAVWVGNRMIIWGGFTDCCGPTNSGGNYKPKGNSWKPTKE